MFKNSGQVFLGKWGKTEVALKVLGVEKGATPSARVSIQRRLIL